MSCPSPSTKRPRTIIWPDDIILQLPARRNGKTGAKSRHLSQWTSCTAYSGWTYHLQLEQCSKVPVDHACIQRTGHGSWPVLLLSHSLCVSSLPDFKYKSTSFKGLHGCTSHAMVGVFWILRLFTRWGASLGVVRYSDFVLWLKSITLLNDGGKGNAS
jgi:hypothetical protein